MSPGHRVAFRHLLARAQLAPALDHVEKLVQKEDWKAARDALFEFAKTFGVFLSGVENMRISTEWFTALDNEDKKKFLEFTEPLRNIWEVAAPRAHGTPGREFEGMWMDRQFEAIRRDLAWVQDVMRDDTDAFKHGKFLVIPTKGVHDVTQAVEALDQASGHIQSKFPQVLYGKVYIRGGNLQGSFDARPGSGLVAGAYQAATDTMFVNMYATPDRNSMMTLIHEFGHRYHTRFLHGDKREEFIRLTNIGDAQEEVFPLAEREKFADEHIARVRKFRDDVNFEGSIHLSEKAEQFISSFPRDEWKSNVTPLLRKFDEGDDSVVPALRKALARAHLGGQLRVIVNEKTLAPEYASEYGRTSWEENFAESFLAFCTGKPLPKGLQRFMASL